MFVVDTLGPVDLCTVILCTLICFGSELPTAVNARHSHDGIAWLRQVAVTTQWWLCKGTRPSSPIDRRETHVHAFAVSFIEQWI
jgi:hypothetical protein